MTALLVASHWVYRAGHRNRTLRLQWIHSLAGAPEKGLFDHLGIASDIEQRHHWFACSNVRSLALVRGRQPNGKQRRAFNPQAFLTTTGAGRKMMSFTKGQTICAQGDAADALFVIQEGQVKLSVKSQIGKEAILDILSGADFVGKDSIA